MIDKSLREISFTQGFVMYKFEQGWCAMKDNYPVVFIHGHHHSHTVYSTQQKETIYFIVNQFQTGRMKMIGHYCSSADERCWFVLLK